MNDVAIKRAEVRQHLDNFYKLNNDANEAGAKGEDATKLTNLASGALIEAHKSADRLVKIAGDAGDLVKELRAAK
jgi:hypothetical protein